MATYQIAPPEKFNFSQPEEWPKWSRRFERFRQASGLTAKEETSQINTLIYAMGDEADDILTSLKLTEAQKKKYDVVLQKFEGYFVKRRNPIFERAKFNSRKQEEGEPVDSFITALHCLAEHCGYGELHDEMIRDRLVVGLGDASLSERLQMDPDLTLEKAVTAARQSEAVKRQQAVVRGAEGQASNVDNVHTRPQQPKRHREGVQQQYRHVSAQQRHKQVSSSKTCTRCGKSSPHSRQQCPAREATCRKCGKKGHYQAVCRSTKSVNLVTTEQDEVFIAAVNGQVPTVDAGDNPWMVTVSVNGSPVDFKIDTGADVSVISDTTYKGLTRKASLRPPRKSLTGPSCQPLEVCGQFTGTLQHGDCTACEEIFVVKSLQMSLLGRPAIESLGLVSRVHTVEDLKLRYTSKYPDLFKGLGKIPGEYHIHLKDDAKPFALSTPRRVALPLQPKVKKELQRMEQLGVISRVDDPTDWCAGMVVVPKSDGKVRICVDLTKLNESVRRERHILPSVDHSLAQLGGAKVFTKLDANSGFWQIELSKESALLTTFITPFGRFCFNRLPFGITSAPEHFQKRMSEILAGLEGVVCMVDDVLVHGRTQEEHDQRLDAAMERIAQAGVSLNAEKCDFSQSSVKFLGHIIDGTGIHPDPEKVQAIQAMKEPNNTTELRRFLGMTNQLAKFTPSLAEQAKPLRDLLSKKNSWVWGDCQQRAFQEIKHQLSSAPILALYDPSRDTIVSADASSYGLGAVLTQKQPDGSWRPVVYASRSLTSTEQRYAQIEKEALALTWACERFECYLLGMQFHLHTDHKPLVPILSSKSLDTLPARVQRFRMRLMRYQFSISHVPGKDLHIADTLSRAPTSTNTPTDDLFCQQVDNFVHLVTDSLPITETRLLQIAQMQEQDAVCQELKEYCLNGWPESSQVKGFVKPYRPVSSEISVQDGLLMRNNRIIIPSQLRQEILNKIHTGHQGIHKCRERARQSVWWPGISRQLEDLIRSCPHCCKERLQPVEPLMPTNFPKLPWEKVATDLFYWQGSNYILVVDYLSRYIEIARLTKETSSEVIRQLRIIFARHGIPREVISDNGPQFASWEFSKFAKAYDFIHTTSSPRYPQSNGEAERAVRTIKALLKKADDPPLALLAYRSTPLKNGYSPAELLMCRKLRTTVPVVPEQLQPKMPDYDSLARREREMRMQQKCTFDQRHKARRLDPLVPGDLVWIPQNQTEGTVLTEVAPRSYQVTTPSGVLRRNRHQLRLLPTPHNCTREEDTTHQPDDLDSGPQHPPADGQYRTRSGRVSVPPDRYEPTM